jgi:hypothetical protein
MMPWIATLALLPVLFVTVYPTPDWPVSLTPYLFLAAMLAGLVFMQWQEKRRPGTLERGAANLISAGTVQTEMER